MSSNPTPACRKATAGKFFRILTIACIVLAATALSAGEQQFFTYLEQAGETRRAISWCLFTGADGCKLVYRSDDETSVTTTDAGLNTLQWETTVPSRNTRVTARREGDRIKLTGQFKGRPLDKTLRIDDKPWYQASSLSLGGFAMSANKRVRFWTLRPDTMKAYKAVAIKQETVQLDIDKTHPEALKIKMRLTGALAPFWRCTYWFNPQNGRFLQFKGPGGAPGTPSVTIRYQDRMNTCDRDGLVD